MRFVARAKMSRIAHRLERQQLARLVGGDERVQLRGERRRIPQLDVAKRELARALEEEDLRIEGGTRILLERVDVERLQAMQQDEQRERVQLGLMLRRAEV